MKYVAIINYGLGNLRSVQNAFSYLGIETKITKDASEIANASGIVIPGVGAFPKAMNNLMNENLIPILKEYKSKGKPILGICLGMQILFSIGFEHQETEGLNWISGEVKKIGNGIRLPHISWANVKSTNTNSWVFNGLDPEHLRFYFVHSFSAQNVDPSNVVAVTNYDGHSIVAIVQNENVIGMQFHPEKSGKVGLQLLRNFCIKCGIEVKE